MGERRGRKSPILYGPVHWFQMVEILWFQKWPPGVSTIWMDLPCLYKEVTSGIPLVANLCSAQATALIRLESRSKRGGRNPSSSWEEVEE